MRYCKPFDIISIAMDLEGHWVLLPVYHEGMAMYLPDTVSVLCQRFLDLLELWNRTHALTSLPREARHEELILDSWALVPYLEHLPAGSRVVDFGSGMGIPAVVLAIARPDLEVIALDKSRKKMAFVRQVVLELELAALKPMAARTEELPALAASLGVAKAVGSPQLLASWWARHGSPGAPLLALKSEAWAQEPCPDDHWSLTPHPYSLPTRGNRIILEIRKQSGP
jgi:16S rRNA (guanine527-N7)-methyltransferase